MYVLDTLDESVLTIKGPVTLLLSSRDKSPKSTDTKGEEARAKQKEMADAKAKKREEFEARSKKKRNGIDERGVLKL
jgi:hypothetical protein